MRFVLAATLMLGVAGSAAAQPAPPAGSFDEDLGKLLAQPGGLTSDMVAARAVEANTTVTRKRAETDEARTGLQSIMNALVPRTSISAGYTRLSSIDSVILGPGVSIDPVLNNYHLGAEVGIPLTELFLRLPPEKRAIEHGIEAAESAEQHAALTASADARVAYYEWVRAELQTVVAQRMLTQVTANLGQIQALAAVDRVSRADVLRLEAQQSQVELALSRVRELAALRAEQVRIAIGVPTEQPLAIGEDVREIGPDAVVASASELTTVALGRRLEMKIVVSARAALAQHRKAAGVDRLPQFNLFAQAIYDNPNQRIFPAEEKFSFTWAAGANVSWNLNRYLDATPHDRGYAAQLRALDADRAALELGVRAQVTAARQAVLLADRAYATSQRGLAAAEESHRVRQELLAAQRATAIELIDADTELTRARIAAIDALIDRRIARARLAHVTGEDIP